MRIASRSGAVSGRIACWVSSPRSIFPASSGIADEVCESLHELVPNRNAREDHGQEVWGVTDRRRDRFPVAAPRVPGLRGQGLRCRPDDRTRRLSHRKCDRSHKLVLRYVCVRSSVVAAEALALLFSCSIWPERSKELVRALCPERRVRSTRCMPPSAATKALTPLGPKS